MQQEGNVASLISETTKLYALCHKQRSQLVSILLEQINDDAKVSKIRLTLLSFQLASPQETDCDKEAEQLGEAVAATSTDQLIMCASTLKSLLQPVIEHGKLLESVAEVCKSNSVGTVSSGDKIHKICNLLL